MYYISSNNEKELAPRMPQTKHYTPAEWVIRQFGGVNKTAKALDRKPPTICYWKSSRNKSGIAGDIPSGEMQRLILQKAKEFGKDITEQDLIRGREVAVQLDGTEVALG